MKLRTNATVMAHPTSGAWYVSPRVDPQILGWLPDFLDLKDPRPAKVQMVERYQYGWNDMKWQEPTFDLEEGGLKFRGDPELRPFAVCHFREEMVVVFPYDIVVIVQKDDTWEIARFD